MRSPLLIVLSFFPIISVSAQTSSSLEARYGDPLKIFEIRPSVMMIARFNSEREVCEMRVERSVGTNQAVDLNTTFPTYLTREIVNELVPESGRGSKGTSTSLSMRNIWADIDYFQHVSITYWHRGLAETDSNIIAIVIKWRHRSGC